MINDWHKAGYLPLGIYTTDDHRRSIDGGNTSNCSERRQIDGASR
jgi:hypothetical protein